ncbi:MAG: nucleotidyltransferase domain-containing protein [Nitrospirota bacterium]
MAIIKTFRPSFLEKEVLENFSRLVEKEIPEALRIIVFGSRARGDSDEGSDLDVAVIFDIPHVSREMWDQIWSIKWRVLESFDAEEFPMSLTLITMKDLESRDFGLENAIKKEGIVIWERQN